MFSPESYETLGAFFLGRAVDRPDVPLLYDSRDLTTHAAILGMTGSGKTGLGIALLEECALDGIPALIIDPKGDLANLALTFPTQSAAEFAPWCDDGEATAKAWRTGLAAWGQTPERVARLRGSADVAVYTPGSDAGRPLSLLGSLAAPATTDPEAVAARIQAVVGGLLGLAGSAGDELASPEHSLLSAILARAWAAGDTLDLAGLIAAVQQPGMRTLGVMDLDTVMPAKARLALALRLNQLLAAPSFAAWTTGAPLDVAQLLFTPEGRPRLAVISIAHLDEAQRMFVVASLLADLLAWMRAQAGTPALRAVLYMDEIAGYLPPIANPPSKAPLMTLLKQARAFGVGVVVASQNPADLDYKALANIGTWWIGRLQTARDREKVMQAFAGDAQAEAIAAQLPTLGKRIFLQRNIHDQHALRIESRWTLSYLRGPLTREDLRRLGLPKPPASAPPSATLNRRPLLPADVAQWFAPVRGRGAPVYRAWALGTALVTYADAKAGIRHELPLVLRAALTADPVAVDWLNAVPAELSETDLERAPARDATFAEVPCAVTAKHVAAWSKAFADACYRTARCELLTSISGEISQPDESEAAFRLRLTDRSRVAREVALDQVRTTYAPKLAALQERLRKARATEAQQREQASSATWDSVLSVGTSLLGAFLGRKAISAANAGRLATGGRAIGRTLRERGDVERAHDTVEVLDAQLADLDAQFKAELAQLEQRYDPRSETFGRRTLVPRKSDIAVRVVGVLWLAD